MHCEKKYTQTFLIQFPRIAGDSTFVKGTKNFSNTTSLVKHSSSECHQRCVEAKQVKDNPAQVPLPAILIRLTHQQNDMMIKLICIAYCLVKQNISLCSFLVLVTLQECNGLPVGGYKNRTAASMFIESIVSVINKSICRIFSVLIDGYK